MADTNNLLFLAIDVLVSLTLIIFIFLFIRTKQGLIYLFSILGLLVLLFISSYFVLPVAHLITQALLILLVVGFPVCFFDDWKQLFAEKKDDTKRPIQVGTLILFSIIFMAVTFISHIYFGAQITQLPQDIALSAANVKSGTAANFGGTTKVKITVSGPRNVISSLNNDSFSALVDVSGKDEGIYDLPVVVTNKTDKIKVIKVDPASATVSVEPIIKKTVPVAVKFSGKAGNDLVPDDPTINPDKVEVSGAKSVIDDLISATAPVHLNGETTALTPKVTLEALASSGDVIPNITFTPSEVTLGFNLVKAGKINTLGVKPIISGQPGENFWVSSITSDPATVSVTGTLDALTATKFISTKKIDISGIKEKTKYKADLDIPSGITMVDSITQVSIEVLLTNATTSKKVTPSLIYDNLNASLSVSSIDPTSISSWISGDDTTLSNTADSAIQVHVDFSAFKSAGTFAINITRDDFTLPTGISLNSYLPSSISVTLVNK